MLPESGGSYSYARSTLGWAPAWMIGWCMVLEYGVAGATVAVGWSGYAVELLSQIGVILPASLTSSPLAVADDGRLVASGALINLPAAAVVAVCAAVLTRGIEGSNAFNVAMVGVKVAVILLVVVAGAMFVDVANWTPFIPPNEGEFGRFGVSGIFTAAAIAFFSYTGFEALSTSAREARNPARDMPVAMIAALLVCAALYISMALVMTGLAPYRDLDVAAPVIVALRSAGGALDWLVPVIAVGTVVGLASAVLISLYGQTRVLYAMAERGDMPRAFGRLNAATRAPARGGLIVGTACSLLAALFPLSLLGELVSMGCLIAFASVCASVLLLRRSHPDLPRPFRIPAGSLVAASGMLSCIALMLSLPAATWRAVGVWILIGLGLMTWRYLTLDASAPNGTQEVT
jgi:APA family basic amino acid/polyamine antiporter